MTVLSFSGLGAHFNSHLAPAAAGMSHVKTARTVEHHLVGLPSIHKILKERVYKDGKVGHEKSAHLFRTFFCQQVAGRVKNQLLADGVT